jgi:hypothetical protein
MLKVEGLSKANFNKGRHKGDLKGHGSLLILVKTKTIVVMFISTFKTI